jgi:phage regulator Rha-like protein
MLDFDLAEMYEVETKVLNQAVKRNIERFPEDFMFRLTGDEWNYMRSQIVTASNQSKRNIKITPFTFTEHGVTMLASILKSEKAVKISIRIVRAFVAMRTYLITQSSLSSEIKELWYRVKALEEQGEENLKAINELSEENQKEFDDIYLALSELAAKQKKITQTSNATKRIIGFGKPKEE